jgi:TPR repeat protein
MVSQIETRKKVADDLFGKANQVWDSGDLKGALKLFRDAADAGHVSAKNSIGYFLDLGLGTRKNSTEAFQWYRKAARQGDLSAYSNVAICYKDAGKRRLARLWFAKAANKGDAGADVELARMLLDSNRKADKAEAFRRLRTALKSKYIAEDERAEAALLLKGHRPTQESGSQESGSE